MQLKSIPWWLWVIASALLFIATERMPYGFYTLTRIVVCGLAAFFAYAGWKGEASRVWSTIFGFVAVLFNPLFPIHLARGTWYGIDLGVAVIFAAHLAFVRLEWGRVKAASQ
jgi:hypothetical protein